MSPRREFAECRHCGEEITSPCSCIACGTPGWRHTVTTFHRCGPNGVGKIAEPKEQS